MQIPLEITIRKLSFTPGLARTIRERAQLLCKHYPISGFQVAIRSADWSGDSRMLQVGLRLALPDEDIVVNNVAMDSSPPTVGGEQIVEVVMADAFRSALVELAEWMAAHVIDDDEEIAVGA